MSLDLILPYVVLEYGIASHLYIHTIIGKVLWYSIFADECTKTITDILVFCFVHMIDSIKPTLMNIHLCCSIAPHIVALTP